MTDLSAVDASIAADMVTAFGVLPVCEHYPRSLGYGTEFKTIVRAWRPVDRS